MAGLQFVRVPSDAERHLSQFVGRHQRRLMPRVQAVVPLEYRSHGDRRFLEAFANEVSPGDLVLMARQAHLPGERLELKVRLSRQDFTFNAAAVSCETTVEDEGKTVRHFVKLSFDDPRGSGRGQVPQSGPRAVDRPFLEARLTCGRRPHPEARPRAGAERATISRRGLPISAGPP